MVSRFREERGRGLEPHPAVVASVTTAGRTILFSAATISCALASTFLFPLYFLRSVGMAAILVAWVAAVGAVVVVPAVLALGGRRIDSLRLLRRRREVSAESPFWRRTATAVMRRPLVYALPVVLLLLALALPFGHAVFGPADERSLPADSPARSVVEDLRADYPIDRVSAITVVPAAGQPALERPRAEISRVPGVAMVAGATGFLLVQPSDHHRAEDLVESIRALPSVAQGDLLVGGPDAVLVDAKTAIVDRLPVALAIVGGTMFTLLFLFTGSVVVPLKALLLNVLVIGAVLGTMVWLFQDAHLGFLGVSPAPLNIPMTVLLCVLVLSLSIDYEIFLLDRIKEVHDTGTDTTEATIAGLGRVGRIVTSAAALLTVTLFSFATGLSFMKMFGIGTGLAIVVDATLVRGILVPSFMSFAGERNWWAPQPLRHLHAMIGTGRAPAVARDAER
jgi:RND superfamily putative drug exporter